MGGKRAGPRCLLVDLVDSGLIAPGTTLYDARKRWAEVRADGTLATKARPARSTAPPGAGLEACNGWTFWHYERNGGLTAIDELRQIARLSMEQAGVGRGAGGASATDAPRRVPRPALREKVHSVTERA